MCCSCGGGNRKFNCVSTEGALRNKWGKDCSYYEGREYSCSSSDKGEFIANNLCCACGGGDPKGEENEDYVEPEEEE